MPGIAELEQLSKSYSLAIGLLLFACAALGWAVLRLYRENQNLYARLASVLEERGKTLEVVVSELLHGRSHS
jgi:hypothetical protein